MRLNILAFAAGVFLLQMQPELPVGWLQWAALAGSSALIVALARRQHWGGQTLVIAACFVLGFGWAAVRADWRLADHLAVEWEGRDVEVVGVVAELPQPFSRGQRFSFDVEQVLTSGARLPSRVMLSWYRIGHEGDTEEFSGIHAGERWRLTLRLKRPHGNANPDGFDYEAWLLERGIRATGYVRPKGDNRRLDALVRKRPTRPPVIFP